ncbi:MAG: hypothetical protein KKF58_00265 [Gammaproteobacteria bacterium]|nr:hypothetical protein [Gammaproteobacteria bacterium]MBU1446719.1 hypothetical protein [Gammaproteobacteria bacterium]
MFTCSFQLVSCVLVLAKAGMALALINPEGSLENRPVIDGAASQSTKPASWQVAGYPAQAGIQMIEQFPAQVGQQHGFVRFAEYFFCAGYRPSPV